MKNDGGIFIGFLFAHVFVHVFCWVAEPWSKARAEADQTWPKLTVEGRAEAAANSKEILPSEAQRRRCQGVLIEQGHVLIMDWPAPKTMKPPSL
jgi:hypothetical protein